jgi:hypothetical protein
MTRIDYLRFLSNSYSEELYSKLPAEQEYDQVMAAPIEDKKWEGYTEWSVELEQSRLEAELERRATVDTPNGLMLIKRECDHPGCKPDRCEQGQRIGGIDV